MVINSDQAHALQLSKQAGQKRDRMEGAPAPGLGPLCMLLSQCPTPWLRLCLTGSRMATACRGEQLAAHNPCFEFSEGVAPLVMSEKDDGRGGGRQPWSLVQPLAIPPRFRFRFRV